MVLTPPPSVRVTGPAATRTRFTFGRVAAGDRYTDSTFPVGVTDTYHVEPPWVQKRVSSPSSVLLPEPACSPHHTPAGLPGFTHLSPLAVASSTASVLFVPVSPP